MSKGLKEATIMRVLHCPYCMEEQLDDGDNPTLCDGCGKRYRVKDLPFDKIRKLKHENKLFRKFFTCAKSLTIDDMSELAHILDMVCAVKFDKMKEAEDE